MEPLEDFPRKSSEQKLEDFIRSFCRRMTKIAIFSYNSVWFEAKTFVYFNLDWPKVVTVNLPWKYPQKHAIFF